jgi:hypothetical protein
MSVVAEQSTEESHHINFKDTIVLTRTMDYIDQILKDGTEIQLHSEYFNTDSGFNQSQPCNPATNMLW